MRSGAIYTSYEYYKSLYTQITWLNRTKGYQVHLVLSAHNKWFRLKSLMTCNFVTRNKLCSWVMAPATLVLFLLLNIGELHSYKPQKFAQTLLVLFQPITLPGYLITHLLSYISREQTRSLFIYRLSLEISSRRLVFASDEQKEPERRLTFRLFSATREHNILVTSWMN